MQRIPVMPIPPDLSGALCSARHLGKEIDRRLSGLHTVAVRDVEGLIFVCLSDTPPDFSLTAVDLAEFLGPHRLHRTRICRREVEIIRANWKVTAAQDRTICENNQLGILSSRYQPGPYTAAESSVSDFVAWYIGELQKETA